MYRKAMIALITMMFVVIVSACGSDKAEQAPAPDEEPAEVVQEISDTEETSVMDIADESPVIADAEDKSSDLYEIYQDGSNYVYFVFHAALAEGTDVKEVVYTIGNYEVAFFNYNDDPQCHVLEKGDGVSNVIADAKYAVEDGNVVITVNTGDIPNVNIGGLETCSAYYTYESGDYVFSDLKMPEVVKEGAYSAKDEKSEAKAENKSDDEQIQSYWFMNKKLSSRGGNWGASHVTLSDPDDNGLPTTVTVTDSGFDVMGNPLDGVFPITIDQYDPYDEMDYLIGSYVGNPGAGIKGEFFDENGKGLTLQVD